jgi:hypothetical protein
MSTNISPHLLPNHQTRRRSNNRHPPRNSFTNTHLSTLLLLSSILSAPVTTATNLLPLRVTNNCKESIWPAILTQAGTAPASSGFLLKPGETNAQTVGLDWKGRVWARTNCSFPTTGGMPASGQGGAPCETGDCGMFLECQGAVSSFCFLRDGHGVRESVGIARAAR